MQANIFILNAQNSKMEINLHVMSKIFLFVFVTKVIGKLTVENYVTLKTKFATITGTLETATTDYDEQETSYFAFRGIPYAEFPEGRMRWMDPILKRPLPQNLLLNATEDKAQCPQWLTANETSVLVGDENCLHASIFVPAIKSTKDSLKPLKIMVFFHGGGFIVNSNRNMLPIPLMAQKNTIVVMFNYRISIFGYLSTGTSVLPGNYAFLDQITMLKWIQMYGEDFGGDPHDVTIFGSSIGSVSIHYLLLSKLSSGLFHKAIMESGSAFCERSLVPNPLEISMKLGARLGCPTSGNQHSLVACLRSKSTIELMIAAKHLTTKWVLPSVLGPVIEKTSRSPMNRFLPDFPEKMPVVNKVPIITGITSQEGLTAFVNLSDGFTWEELHNLGTIQKIILPQYLDLIMRSRASPFTRQIFIDNLAKEVMLYYWEDFSIDPIATLVGVLGDIWINTCHRKTLEHLCINAVPSVHAYLFSHHDAKISPSEINKQIQSFHNAGINHPILDHGVAHTEEILYILENEEDIRRLDGGSSVRFPRNKLMSTILSRMWTNFAISSTPVSHEKSYLLNEQSKWTPICYTSGNHSFFQPDYPLFEINLDKHRMFPNYRIREAEFWWKKHLDILLSEK